LKEIADLYRVLLDNLHEAVYFTDCARVIRFWNKGAERMTGFNAAEVEGRRCSDNILVHVNGEGSELCLGACPLSLAMQRGAAVQEEVFLRHKDGHRIPVAVRVCPIRDESGRVIGAVESFNDNSSKLEILRRMEECQASVLLDPVTEVGNRRFIDLMLRARMDELRRYGWGFGVVFLDIDQFKQVNDKYGHLVGDGVIRMVGRTLSANIRTLDFVGRWGGDEFLVIATHVDEEALWALAEKLRSLIACSRLPASAVSVTVSAGSTVALANETPKALLERADKLLYLSKSRGRNQVSTDGPPTVTIEECRHAPGSGNDETGK
jgi:diguanylate cyclase (GGDEF)-like protein/PAS domain S-box-containing protein